jgi:hypothetical protein
MPQAANSKPWPENTAFEESALRDAVLLTAAGDDPGPAGKLFLAT